MTERARTGVALGGGLAWAVLGATLAPAALVAFLLWPTPPAPPTPATPAAPAAPAATTATTTSTAPPSVDFAALKKLATAAAQAAPATTTAARASVALEPARVEASRALQKRIFHARDVRRAAGADYAELRRAFSVDDLGGDAAMNDLGVAAGKRLLIARPELKVLAPASAALPAGIELASKEKDEDVLEADATLDGKPVHVVRRCVAGELSCLVDILAATAPATPSTAASSSSASSSSSSAAAAAELVRALDAEAAKLQAWKPPPPPPPPSASSTRVAPVVAVLAGAVLAIMLGLLLGARLRAVGGLVFVAASRLRAVSAGTAGAPTPPSSSATRLPAEIAEIERAIDEAAVVMHNAVARASVDAAKNARAEVIATSLKAAQQRLDQRVVIAPDDDAVFATVISAANALVEAFEVNVVRWKSHADVVAAPPRVSSVEDRAQAIAPLPHVFIDVADKLVRASRNPGVPPKLAEELQNVGKVLAERGKNAQILVDQLLLDAATDRKGDRPAAALIALREELAALSPQPTAPTTVAALHDLPPSEIAARLDDRAAADGVKTA